MKNRAWLPNSVTLLNLILGFYAIILIIREQFVIAAFLIFVGMILDGIDGRLARKIAVDNPIGKELDSLADLISFGVTPSLLIYQMYLTEYSILGVVVAVIFPVCGAVRLARFNAVDSTDSSNYFKGLPITAGGGILISFVLAGASLPSVVFIPIVLLVGYLMISTIKYPNFKKATPFQAKFIIAFIGACLVIALNNPSSMLMNMLVGYVCLGLGLHVSPIPKLARLFYTS
ncbi:MAG: hypothetical protein APF76_18015 [Desulfitibacter sp. BRH_c19]|nr:MAG: hypothetical protein APF76_18015 [Desulfitibacter sp. BRH_c19]